MVSATPSGEDRRGTEAFGESQTSVVHIDRDDLGRRVEVGGQPRRPCSTSPCTGRCAGRELVEKHRVASCKRSILRHAKQMRYRQGLGVGKMQHARRCLSGLFGVAHSVAGKVNVTCPVSSYQQFPGRWLNFREKPLRQSRCAEEQMVAVLRKDLFRLLRLHSRAHHRRKDAQMGIDVLDTWDTCAH